MHKASFMLAGAHKIYAGQLYMNHVMGDPVCWEPGKTRDSLPVESWWSISILPSRQQTVNIHSSGRFLLT